MGSKFSKATRPRHGKVTTSERQHHEHANESGPCQEPPSRLPDVKLETLAQDDTNLAVSTGTATSLQRRNSAADQLTEVLPHSSMDSENTASSSSSQALEAMQGIEAAANVGTDPALIPPAYTSVPPFPIPPPADDGQTDAISALPVVTCLTCCTQLPKENDPKHAKEVIKPCRLCESPYCTDCIKSMFIDACKDTSRMPPRCCVQIHLHHARPFLTEEEAAEFRSKYEEWSTPKPFYCPVSTCSVFISDRLLPQCAKNKGKQRVDSGVGTPTPNTFACPKCETDICADCRQVAHVNSLCNNLEFGIDAEMAELLKRWGYKRCPKCGQGLKRMYGCSHMECRCGAHFCWGCMRSREECDGECGEDEDEDDNEDYNSEEEEESHEPESATQSADTATLITTQPEDSANTIATTQASSANASETTTLPQPIVRSRNLDGRGPDYWISQDLYFGDEPSEDIQDRSWDCTHSFSVYEVPLAAALTNSPSAINIECVKCWCTIYPEIRTPQKLQNDGEKMVSGRTGGRGRRRGSRRFAASRGLVRADTIAGTALRRHTAIPLLSQSVPAHEPSPMEDIQYTDRIRDTYGNIITTSNIEASRRNSFDNPNLFGLDEKKKKTPDTFPFTFSPPSGVSIPTAPPFSLAHECNSCKMLVCETCKADLQKMQKELDVEDGVLAL